MATTLADVLRFIHVDMTSPDRKAIVQAVNDAQRRLEREAKADLYVGCPVEWDSKSGQTVKGKIDKINPRSIHVTQDGTMMKWRVSPNLVRVVSR